ncbi:HAMP domain-containing protein [Desulfoprunum benzoelyticum]|uniref:histidine kinase n=1 Tax=Desulfoprunum benzoelyticum TaxID=1506996 RepID=A0A840V352_9BACT|nr:ATP-binding protein [Desulfoprunum benzoelyticum]MBB5348290.1 NtrC-family two-component system sensor histidine kinase KinB [Desulfoprunum benzoelyticum]MBM9529519.1 HAMP domain-containing protein [Desulfoprunum benzoelyticum]
MNLKKKILIGYGVAFSLMGLVVTWAIINLWSLGKTTDAILRDYYRSILAVENMLDALGRQDSGVLLMVMGDTRKGVSQYRENEAIFLEWLGRSKDSIAVKGELEAVQAIQANYGEYRRRSQLLTDMPDPERASLPETLKIYRESILPVFSQVKATCIELRTINEKTMYAVSEKARRVAKQTIWSTIMVASIASVLALFFSLVFAERLVLPLRRFVEAVRKISAGEFSVELSVETRDELGELALEFNRMTTELRRYHMMNVDRIVAEKNKADAILASIEDGLVVFDTDQRVTGINPAGRRILRVEPQGQDLLYCEQILPVRTVCEVVAATISSGSQPEIADDRRIITLSCGAETRHFLFSATAIGQKDQKLTGVVLLLKDITQLREFERLKSEFVMAASHELRTPLTSLGMSIDLLIEHASRYLPEREKELLQAAHDEVYRMKAMVHDLLDLSKIEAGRIDLEFESVPVALLFDNAREIFRGQINMKQIRLQIADVGHLPQVRADTNKIVWVLSNLVSNALRYVEEGGYIRLAAEMIGDFIHLSVEDNGVGIPAEYQSRIFQKFVRVDKQESGRTGLGLAICREIVRAHGGTIWVKSDPGQGSVFTFTVPIADPGGVKRKSA